MTNALKNLETRLDNKKNNSSNGFVYEQKLKDMERKYHYENSISTL